MPFRIGQKVVCINNTARPGYRWNPGSQPVLNRVYTIAGFLPSIHDGTDCFLLSELTNYQLTTKQDLGFYADRFRPLVEKKTDITFAHEILRKVTQRRKVSA